MKIHQLPGDPGRRKKSKRLGRGRGTGQGTYAGRGNKGQKSRSGASRSPAFEGGQMPLIRRVPKRGFTKRFRIQYAVVNVNRLEEKFDKDETVTVEALKERRLIKGKNPRVKILGVGEITKPLVVHAHKFSRSAVEKITSAGGKCEVIGNDDSEAH